MFDISWIEMLVVAVILIIVVKPADLPGALRAIGKMTGNARRMASDLQRQFNEALKESGIDQLKNELSRTASLSGLTEEAKLPVGELADKPDRKINAGTEIQEDKSGTKTKKRNMPPKEVSRKIPTGKKTVNPIPEAKKTVRKTGKKTTVKRRTMTSDKRV